MNIYGGNIGTPTTGYISAYELGWDYEAALIWLVKYDGSYNNDCIFAGNYRREAKENNFYPMIMDNVALNKGSNEVDWIVTPYVRIIDPDIVFDASAGKFKATFKLQYGDASKANTIYKAMLCCYPDKFVGFISTIAQVIPRPQLLRLLQMEQPSILYILILSSPVMSLNSNTLNGLTI